MSVLPRTTTHAARLLAVTATAGVLLAGVVTNASAAHAASGTQDWGAASQFVSQINNARSANGKPRLATSSALTSAAASWAASMARSNILAHNPHLSTSVTGWKYLGENVGVGYSVTSLQQAFWGSAGHRANILDSAFTQLGVAVVNVGGKLWVAEEFMRPSGAVTPSHSSARKGSIVGRAASADTVTRKPTAGELARHRLLQRAFEARHDRGPTVGVYMFRNRTQIMS